MSWLLVLFFHNPTSGPDSWGIDWSGLSGAPQDRNRIHGFYSDICFSKITKLFAFLVIIRIKNKKERRIITI
jgi:hypothetical protein